MKYKCFVGTILLLLTISSVAESIKGDVNGDGRLSVADFSAIVAYIMGNTPTDFHESAADANGDGTISVADLSYIINKVIREEECAKEEPSEYKDTLFIRFDNDTAIINNPLTNDITILQNKADVEITSSLHKGFAIVASGISSDGRLRINADTTYTLRLNGLSLTSSHAPAINSISKQKMTLELADQTVNKLEDAKKYIFNDTIETANGCVSSLGAVTFKGKGTLEVKGKSKHAIYAKKTITFNDGIYNVTSAPSDAIHSGKSITIKGGEFFLDGMQGEAFDMDDNFTMSGGSITMNITGEAAKGIKSGSLMNISDGEITATASGALRNKKGDLSYCTILKCDSSATISGGDLHLVNNSAGGRCISVDYNLTIDGGTFYLETNGDGAECMNVDGEKDYYTSKCLSVDDTLLIQRGNIECLSTGIGGKGIVVGKLLEIGLQTDHKYQLGPNINVTTTNCSIVNDVEEDERYGCPKAIKASKFLNIYSGDIHCTTSGMGGEGIECGKEMYIYGGNLECNCFDDGINVGENLEILGGQIYCNSEDNDGIDSNGSIYIKGGIVASVNQEEPNESFDAENRQFHVSGGIVIGIGSSSVKMDQQESLYYNTLYNVEPDKPARRGLRLTNGKYVYVMDGDNLLLTLKNDNLARRGFLTVALPEFQENHNYSIYQGDEPFFAEKEFFERKLFIKGEPLNKEFIIDIQPKYNYND